MKARLWLRLVWATCSLVRSLPMMAQSSDQSNWKALVLVMLSTFEDDVLGDLMPVESPIESYGWEIDASGDIMPAA